MRTFARIKCAWRLEGAACVAAYRQNRRQDFLRFLKLMDAAAPDRLGLEGSKILHSTLFPGYIAEMARGVALNRIAEAAQDQWGLITRRQAELAGVPQTTMERLTAPGSVLDRVAYGVYRMAGAPEPEHQALRAAWLQLEPGVWAWERTPAQGVVSYRSAAALYGLGDLPADRHEFTVSGRKQTRRPDVRLHQRSLSAREWVPLDGLPVTRPARIASDLLDDHEDPEGIAQIVADAIRGNYEYPGVFADSLAAQAARFGLLSGDGHGVVRWLLDLVGDPGTPRWLDEARAHLEQESAGSNATRRVAK